MSARPMSSSSSDNNNPDDAGKRRPRMPRSARAPAVVDFANGKTSSALLMKKSRLQHALTDAKQLRPETAVDEETTRAVHNVEAGTARHWLEQQNQQQQPQGDSCDEESELLLLLQKRTSRADYPEQQLEQIHGQVAKPLIASKPPPSAFSSPDDLVLARKALQLTIAKMRATSVDPSSLERLQAAFTTELPLSFARNPLTKLEKRDARCWYAFGKIIGKGTFGCVYSAQHRLLSGSQVAIKGYFREPGAAACCRPPISNPSTSRTASSSKHIKRPPDENALDWKRVRQEVKMMAALRPHPNIIQFIEAFETPTQMHVVMEFVKGENLCDHLRRTNATSLRLSEPEARGILCQVCAAVASLHDQHVIHRDLKLENVLVDKCGRAKLIDFGFSQFDYSGTSSASSGSSSGSGSDAVTAKNFCGTPSYMAPEVVTSVSYDGKSVDVWSLGVLLYVLLCGKFPFQGQSFHQLHQSILRLSSSSKGWSFPGGLSKDAQSLLRSVLVIDPKKRPRVRDMLTHPWMMTTPAASLNGKVNKSVQRSPPVVDNLRHQERFFAFLQWDEAQTRFCEALVQFYGLHEAELKSALREKRQNGVTAFICLAILTAQKKTLLLADSATSTNSESSGDNDKVSTSNSGSDAGESGGSTEEPAGNGSTHKQHLEKLIGLVKASLIV